VIEALNLGADFYLQKGGSPAPQFAELEHKIKLAVSQKQSERRISETEERYSTLFENASDAIFMMERDVFVDCNAQALELFGCTREQLIGSHTSDYSPAFKADDCQSEELSCGHLHDALSGVSGICSWRFHRCDGRVLDVEISLTHLDVSGRDLVLAIVRDASERKQVECALRESAQLMTNIISFLPDATFAINRDGRVIAWNRAMEEMTGISSDAIIGKGDYEYSLPIYGVRRPILIDLILSQDETIASHYTTIEEVGNNLISEIFVPGLYSGRGAHIWFTASPLIDSHGNVIGAIESIRDITARKNREIELRASYEQIAAMEEELRNNLEELVIQERVVAESEANYRALFSAMVEGHAVNELVYDGNGMAVEYRILQVNPAFEKIFNIPRDAAIGKNSREVFGVDESSALTLYAEVARTGIPRTFETWYPPMKKHFAISVYSPKRGIFATVFEDISERRQKEQELRAAYEQITAMEEELRNNLEELLSREHALRESAQLMTNIISFLPDATFAINSDGRVIAWNLAMEKLTGISANAMIGKGDYEYSLPIYGERRPILIDLILSRDETIASQYTTIEKEGTTLFSEVFVPGLYSGKGAHIWFTATPLIDTRGNIVGAIESIRDITAHKNRQAELQASYEQVAAVEEELRNNFEELALREQALRTSEEHYRRIVNTANEGIWSIDDGLKATFVNPRLADMLGYSSDEILGRPIVDFIHAEEMPDHAEKIRHRRTGASSVYERKFCKKDGAPLWCLVSATPLLDAGGMFKGSFAMLTDITARKIASQELEQKNLELNAANEQMAAAFEELKSTEESLLAQNRELEMQRETIRKSKQAILVANRKLNLLSGLTRHDVANQLTALSGYVELSADWVQDPKFHQVIKKQQMIIEMIHRQILFTKEYENMGVNAPVWQSVGTTAMNAALGLDLSGICLKVLSDNLEIYADPLLIKGFYNLMDNTLRYGENVSEITISCKENESGLVITYTDNGVGIDADTRLHLFKRGFGKQTGLGLFFTREVLAITGLSITETGTPGKGARFEITVPKGEYRISDTKQPSP
jgi:PAS domain S-box-containing protein